MKGVISNSFRGYEKTLISKDNFKKFKIDNNDLVHYSLTNRGNALYFQKIIINKIFRTANLELHKYSDNFNSSIRFLSFGGKFQQKYSMLSSINQLKRNTGSLIWNNNVGGMESFKNLLTNSAPTSLDKFLIRDMEPKKTEAMVERAWNYMFHLGISATYYNFLSRVRSAYKILPMKSLYLIKTENKQVLCGKSILYEKVKEMLINKITNLNFFIRTIWYKNTLSLNNYRKPLSLFDNGGYYSNEVIKTQRFNWIFAGNSKNNFFSTLGFMSNRWFDVAKELKLRSCSTYKRHVKRYSRWRLGIAHWGRKILKFKKNYLFWKYMRGLSTYFYRGYYLNSVFNCRIDTYILRMFGVRTLKFARMLVSSGHVFIGTWAVKNHKTEVKRYNVVTLSKKSNIFINKKRYFKYWKNNKTYTNKKIQNRMIKSAPLIFCRQQKNSLFWGEIKNIKYSMYFGRSLHVLNSENKKTKYFSLNYFYIQKSVASAWW